ncbi:MAG TPA: FAD binding domain-containing protein [Gaiella sp.]|nr:FAD binding domain-containing protein [Gaiella sp.]
MLLAPGTLDEALALRAEHPDATPVAGGTDLMVEVNAGRVRPATLLDLSRVEELRTWRRESGLVFVGSGMTFARIARELCELGALVQAARSVASPQIRNRATLGGNLATASPAGDSLPVLAAYDADVVVASARAGTRRMPLRRFLLGPKRTSLAPDELIVGAEWRPVAGPGSFAKVGRRSAMVIAVASVCLQADPTRHAVRLALGSVAPTVLRAPGAEAFAQEVDWSDPAAVAEFGRRAAAEAQPIDDLRGSAAYRRRVVEGLARRALSEAARC